MALGIALDRVATVGAVDLRSLAQRYRQGEDVVGVSAWSAVAGGTGLLLVCELGADRSGGKGFPVGDADPGPGGGESNLRYRIIGRILERHRVVYRPLPTQVGMAAPRRGE